MSIADIRQDFPALAHVTHLNSGGMAPLPTPVIDALLRIPQHVATYGPGLLTARDEELTHAEASHRTLAAFMGVERDEIALMTQFSAAVNIVVEGLGWQAGDEIVTTDQEHPALLTPLLNIARRHDVTIRRLPVSESDDAMLSGLTALLTPRTRLVAASHVTTETGNRLPVAEIARLAHARGARVFYDGAQSLGQFPINVPQTGCDFYAVVGYKWLFGMYPSAALYLRGEAMDAVDVTWTGSGVTETAGVDMDRLVFMPGARRFEYGGRVYAQDAAMAAGAEYVSGVGVAAIEAHARQLTEYLHQALARVPGARIHSPRDLTRTTGIVTISVPGFDGPTLANALRERWNILTRSALHGTSVRVSIAAFTNTEDLDTLVGAVASVAAGR